MFKVNNKVSTIRSLYLLLLMSNVNLFYLFFSTSTVDFEDVNTSWGLSNSRCFFVLRLLQPVFGKTLVKLVIMKQWCLRNLQPECINKNCTTVIYNIYNSRKSLVNQKLTEWCFWQKKRSWRNKNFHSKVQDVLENYYFTLLYCSGPRLSKF